MRLRTLLAGLGLLTLSTTHCTTSSLVNKFNTGLLDSPGDPCRDPSDRRRAIVKQLVLHELEDGFFTQGTSNGAVERWLERASRDTGALVQAVHAEACALGNNLGVRCPTRLEEASADQAAYGPLALTRIPGGRRARFAQLGARWRGAALPSAPICKPDRSLDETSAADLADAIRFDAAVGRATSGLVSLAIEGIVHFDDVKEGAGAALRELFDYLGRRKWKRRFDRPVTGVVIKGGASTGLYSAGVVWTALNLIDACLDDNACKKAAPDLRFDLVSGTSTGAMIAVGIEMFNAAKNPADRKTALGNFVDWFTCKGVADLYCVRGGDALALMRDQRGMVEFDGIQRLLEQNIANTIFDNGSELVLNTVDFRTGTLFDLSDQNELRLKEDVVQGAIASAVLPWIANPVDRLPVDYDPAHSAPTYLDGGIRAELPILPLVRRGVERMLIVSSSASVTIDTTALKNAMEIALRYIDVSTGGVTESEIQHAQRHVESVRLAEIDACREADATKTACGGDEGCVKSFCGGDFKRACDPSAAETEAPGSPFDLTNARLSSLWGTRSFYRNEQEVDGLHGYDFDPPKQRRLFLAGAELARERCGELAMLLGIPKAMVRAGGSLAAACARPLPAAQCAQGSTSLRTCEGPPPAPITGVCR